METKEMKKVYLVTKITPEQQGREDTQLSPQQENPASTTVKGSDFPTKKATTIMPKEVFAALQRYCIDIDMQKYRVLYRFIIDGLQAAGTITDDDYQRFRGMAAQLTMTYEKMNK